MTSPDPATGHRLQVVSSSRGRRISTSLPRGQDVGHQLCCGRCDMVLAHWWRLVPAGPLLRCNRCHALNDTTVVRGIPTDAAP